MYLEDHRISKLLLTLQYSNMACWKIHQQQFKDSPVHISIYYSDFFHMFSMFPMFFPVFFLFNYGISHNCRRKSHRPRARPDSLAFAALARKVTSSVVSARVERSNWDFPMECDQHHIQCGTPRDYHGISWENPLSMGIMRRYGDMPSGAPSSIAKFVPISPISLEIMVDISN